METIRYKVVLKDRISVVGRGQKDIIRQKLCLKYEKGKIVKAQDWSMGILYFDYIHHARKFSDSILDWPTKILRIIPLEEEERIYILAFSTSERKDILTFAETGVIPLHMNAPVGTMACKTIKVLD